MKKRIEDIEISGIRSFGNQCSKIKGIVSLTIGEPDLDTPQAIKDAAIEALAHNKTHYPPALGQLSLRQLIAQKEASLYGESLTEANVIITNGATEALALAFWSTLEAGDEVIQPIPGYTMYRSQIALVGAKTVTLDTLEDNYQINEQALRELVTDKTKAIILTSPNNPTGSIFNEESLLAVAKVMRDYPQIVAVLDEVYSCFVYEGELPSMRIFDDLRGRLIVVQAFSKSHAMTGWRIGYAIAPVETIDLMHKLHQNLVTGVSTFTQEAALVAYDVDTDYMRDDYRERRDYVTTRLNAMGLTIEAPRGAFYIFPDISEFGLSSYDFAVKCANEAKVALVPGVYFGSDRHVRISYCYGKEVLKIGMDRLEIFVNSLRLK